MKLWTNEKASMYVYMFIFIFFAVCAFMWIVQGELIERFMTIGGAFMLHPSHDSTETVDFIVNVAFRYLPIAGMVGAMIAALVYAQAEKNVRG